MRIDCGNRVSAGLRYGLTLWLGVSAAAGTWICGQSVRRAAVSHIVPGKGAAAGTVPAGTSDALMDMAAAASVIFAGYVEAVTRNDAAGYVDVQFRIDQALRGCPSTGVYVLREWAGLWSGRADRYAVGQRRLMLLPARGPSGMSAPVGGMDGAIPIVGTGAEPLLGAGGIAPADDGSGGDGAPGVDLRWITARAARGTVASSGPLRAMAGGAVGRPVLPNAGDSSGDGWSGPVAPLSPAGGSSGASGTAAQRPSLSAVLALLQGSGGVSNGVR